MNTTHSPQGTFSIHFNKWLFTTIFSVAISGFLTLLVGILSQWSGPIISVALWLTTSLFSCWAQVVVINSAFHVQFSRWFPWLLVSSIIGWMISLLLVYSLIRMAEVSLESAKLGGAAWVGFIAGGTIGLFPGICIGLAYWWLMRPDDNVERLIVSNVIGWYLGMGLAFASILVLFAIIVSRMITIF
jgi:hypothetical protein